MCNSGFFDRFLRVFVGGLLLFVAVFGGWVWGYINADESIAAPASEKGSQCISCHSQSDNIDYMLMNKYFP